MLPLTIILQITFANVNLTKDKNELLTYLVEYIYIQVFPHAVKVETIKYIHFYLIHKTLKCFYTIYYLRSNPSKIVSYLNMKIPAARYI